MIIDEVGLPRDMGASDKQDSVRLAGLCVGFGFKNFDLTQYVAVEGQAVPLRDDPTQSMVFKKTTYVRHPREYKFDLSRDQFICLMFGLWKMGRADLIDLAFINGKDLFSPAVKGIIAKAKGQEMTWLQKKWLKADMIWNANITPLEEPCQLFSMLMIAGNDYVKEYCKMNPRWELAFLRYFAYDDGAWRGEKEFADFMIVTIRGIING